MAFTDRVRRISPRTWFFFKFLRYKHLKGEREIRLLSRLVPVGKNAIDVGSSIGLYARELAKHAPHVYAFEPNPSVAAFAGLVAPSNVQTVNVALSSREGEATLRIPINHRCNPSNDLATIEPRNAGVSDNIVSFAVPTKRLDDFNFANCGFIKIDVEGHEEAVLDGATSLIEKFRPILMIELEDRHNRGTVERVVRRLLRQSYAAFTVSRSKLAPLGPSGAAGQNFIFIPQESISSLDGLIAS
jgi:FkbM family methyltransferase